ncbi:hypothetical protein NDN08_005835 [Rhodosorus marinus]|uniref:Rad21/Rec8-like protein N-terminal domain-containing protein n=1 Tax=Rhodosorus marinus TaxID=101924 RepID=A0AAV8V2Q8_9RHOD|nr:hypothetical protein NDN08_005835 [Rhodosorus marinus]
MFYSSEILTRRGPLAEIWTAATLGKDKIKKGFALKAPIENICTHIVQPRAPLALRLSAQLMVGVCRVFVKKCTIILSDVTDLMSTIQMFNSKSAAEIDLPLVDANARFESITVVNMDQQNQLNLDLNLRLSYQHATAAESLLQGTPSHNADGPSLLGISPARSFQADVMDITLSPGISHHDDLMDISTEPGDVLRRLLPPTEGYIEPSLGSESLFFGDPPVGEQQLLLPQGDPEGSIHPTVPLQADIQPTATAQDGRVQSRTDEPRAQTVSPQSSRSTRKRRLSDESRVDTETELGREFRRACLENTSDIVGRKTREQPSFENGALKLWNHPTLYVRNQELYRMRPKLQEMLETKFQRLVQGAMPPPAQPHTTRDGSHHSSSVELERARDAQFEEITEMDRAEFAQARRLTIDSPAADFQSIEGSSMRPTSLGTGGQETPLMYSAEPGLGSQEHGQQDITGPHQSILPDEELPDPIDLQEGPGPFEKLDVKSFKMLKLLRRTKGDEMTENKDFTCTFDEITESCSRGTTARMFYQVLVLAGNNFVQIHQAEPFAEIKITAGDNF